MTRWSSDVASQGIIKCIEECFALANCRSLHISSDEMLIAAILCRALVSHNAISWLTFDWWFPCLDSLSNPIVVSWFYLYAIDALCNRSMVVIVARKKLWSTIFLYWRTSLKLVILRKRQLTSYRHHWISVIALHAQVPSIIRVHCYSPYLITIDTLTDGQSYWLCFEGIYWEWSNVQ